MRRLEKIPKAGFGKIDAPQTFKCADLRNFRKPDLAKSTQLEKAARFWNDRLRTGNLIRFYNFVGTENPLYLSIQITVIKMKSFEENLESVS